MLLLIVSIIFLFLICSFCQISLIVADKNKFSFNNTLKLLTIAAVICIIGIIVFLIMLFKLL